jgi:cellulose synthase/poly-beta-1,6-N-acetylglucosamine synthase-like glycosyltransferase
MVGFMKNDGMLIQILFFTISLFLTVFFVLYGFNHYYLLLSTRRYKKPDLPEILSNRPTVSIHLPIYNERYVVRRLIAACAAMAEAYGIDRVNIKVLDDSTDDTSREIDEIIRESRSKGLGIEVLRRENRTGFKAGALQAALEKTAEEYVAVFDADFIPTPDFLLLTLPYLAQDARLGIVQSRWTHLNRDFNLLTQAIAIGIDVHFLIEQTGRYAAGCFQNFNGSAGVLRKSAILEAGGWQADTLAEDLDLSYRMQNLGYRILFLKGLHCPGEIPPTVPSFKRQQRRWACGSLRTARKLLPDILGNHKLSFKLGLEAFFHLTGYLIHPMMLFSFLVMCLITLFGIPAINFSTANPIPVTGSAQGALGFSATYLFVDFGRDFLPVVIGLCSLAPWVSMIITLRLQNLSPLKNLAGILITFLLGFGISLSNTIEAGKALFSNRVWDFTRTPKYADLEKGQEWTAKIYQVPLDFTWVMELALFCLGVISIGVGISHSNFSTLAILIPYTAAYGFVFILTVFQSREDKV